MGNLRTSQPAEDVQLLHTGLLKYGIKKDLGEDFPSSSKADEKLELPFQCLTVGDRLNTKVMVRL